MGDKRARKNLIVIGIGNVLREDDGVGIELVRRLGRHFGSDLACQEVYEADIVLAETLASYAELLVIDAIVLDEDRPFRLIPLEAKEAGVASGGFISHVFDWGVVLGLSRRCFGASADANLLGVSAKSFGFGEKLSPACAAHADEAYSFLLEYCSAP